MNRGFKNRVIKVQEFELANGKATTWGHEIGIIENLRELERDNIAIDFNIWQLEAKKTKTSKSMQVNLQKEGVNNIKMAFLTGIHSVGRKISELSCYRNKNNCNRNSVSPK